MGVTADVKKAVEVESFARAVKAQTQIEDVLMEGGEGGWEAQQERGNHGGVVSQRRTSRRLGEGVTQGTTSNFGFTSGPPW